MPGTPPGIFHLGGLPSCRQRTPTCPWEKQTLGVAPEEGAPALALCPTQRGKGTEHPVQSLGWGGGGREGGPWVRSGCPPGRHSGSSRVPEEPPAHLLASGPGPVCLIVTSGPSLAQLYASGLASQARGRLVLCGFHPWPPVGNAARGLEGGEGDGGHLSPSFWDFGGSLTVLGFLPTSVSPGQALCRSSVYQVPPLLGTSTSTTTTTTTRPPAPGEVTASCSCCSLGCLPSSFGGPSKQILKQRLG